MLFYQKENLMDPLSSKILLYVVQKFKRRLCLETFLEGVSQLKKGKNEMTSFKSNHGCFRKFFIICD